MSHWRNNQRGFSLLEMLIAFSILAVSLGILLKIFSTGITTAQVADNYTMAAQIANNLIAKTGVETPLKISEELGIENDFYHWRVRVNPQTFVSPELDLRALPVELFNVNVLVWWGDDDKTDDRVLELNTMKLAAKNE
ncbi:MAG: prepilin-type N-terminal cleavage/methylation domain-containing protein [Methylococcaceae bacterium]|jgi:general secretion pathway protein I